MEIKTCQECNAFAPTHHAGCSVGCAVVAEMAAEDRALRRREVEAQERLALATQLDALRQIRGVLALSVQSGNTGMIEELETVSAQYRECFRRLNELTQPLATKETT